MYQLIRGARRLARSIIRPPIKLDGPYQDWAAACMHGQSYDEPAILQRMTHAADAVAKSDGRLHERDGVVFTSPVTPYPVAAYLLDAALRNSGRLFVLDFGGALGSTYWQCRSLLGGCATLQWNVVERRNVVSVGRERFQSSELRFFESVTDASASGRPDAVLISGVLQYLDDPYGAIGQLAALAPGVFISDRHPFHEGDEDLFGVQIVPPEIYSARIPFRVFSRDAIGRALPTRFTRVADFSTVDPEMRIGTHTVMFRGEVFQKQS